MSNTSFVIRFAQADDAQAFCFFQRKVAEESKFLLLQPEEVSCDVELKKIELERYEQNSSHVKILIAELERNIVGFIGYRSGPLVRVKHVVRDIAIAVLDKHQGNGIGKNLLGSAEEIWRNTGKTVAKISVMENNRRALNLYMSCGYKVEGMDNNSICQSGLMISQINLWKNI